MLRPRPACLGVVGGRAPFDTPCPAIGFLRARARRCVDLSVSFSPCLSLASHPLRGCRDWRG
eukprot:6255332-Pyramimonas_sp.AAC.1